ncbi:two-component system, NtrC family, C4-dicarboxylate transport sensor histidine kinase DctB [Maridesulfovibrio ferrireducens]|uniref:C4-dicarboxylate transport sensor protein DctB n=1 Tax=Maridesulfovibrio ferrireducens TaxID=246191 RepID=A0A1G9LRB7_9BACT|nr:ATP-binding protein [Maridesulfovibrio ferrireducens]SDL64500.1 two-component system, NtrC family, C4-dicarboxylate transport sensor histidine kinase DctB [Maridesulfovibrio ferrireducens]
MKSSFFALSLKQRIRIFLFSVLTLLAVSLLGILLVQYYLKDMTRVADERLTLYENTLKLQLNKYSYLPFLVARSSLVRNFLVDGIDKAEVNVFLEEASHKADSTAVYLVDSSGIVLCSSNWNKDNSYIGLDLSFRPYFKEGIKGKEKRFYGVGFASEQPGYYISYPVMVNGSPKGVAVVKIDLSRLQTIWKDGGETIFVADSKDIIILSSRPAWQYRTLITLSPETLRTIQEGGQYPEPKLRRLEFEPVFSGMLNMVRIDGQYFRETTRHLKSMDWTISYFMGVRPLWERILGISLTSFVLIGLAILIRMFLNERHLKNVSRQQAREADKIQAINIRLEQEIKERERTERELRAAQKELIEAGKLAAVGEMATAVAHELNQPISALKMYVASCRLMLKRNKTTELDPTLVNVLGISDRMARVTEQLKSFARKSSECESEFDLREAVNATLALMKHQFELEGCEVMLNIPEYKVSLLGDCGRFEQVLINLFRNALDAMQGQENKLIGVNVQIEQEMVIVRVLDNGPGIDAEVDSSVFEPFVTTKKEGVGLGLGLSISYKIIKDMGGRIWVENRSEGGAEFCLKLPLYQRREDAND